MGACASAPAAASQHELDVRPGRSSQSLRGSSRSRYGSGRSAGSLVLVQVQAAKGDTLYMCRTDKWHSFAAAGVLVEAQLGLGDCPQFDVLLAGPPGVLAYLHEQATLEGLSSQLHASTRTLNLRWDALQALPGVVAVALAPPATPLSAMDVARAKAFVASAAVPREPPEDWSRRARLLSSRARKVFLPVLVGELLVSMGQMQRCGDDLYSACRGHTWMMPDLRFVALPHALPPPHPASGSLTSSAGGADELHGTWGPSTNLDATRTLSSSLSSITSAGARPTKEPSLRHGARRQQQHARSQQLAPGPAAAAAAVHPPSLHAHSLPLHHSRDSSSGGGGGAQMLSFGSVPLPTFALAQPAAGADPCLHHHLAPAVTATHAHNPLAATHIPAATAATQPVHAAPLSLLPSRYLPAALKLPGALALFGTGICMAPARRSGGGGDTVGGGGEDGAVGGSGGAVTPSAPPPPADPAAVIGAAPLPSRAPSMHGRPQCATSLPLTGQPAQQQKQQSPQAEAAGPGWAPGGAAGTPGRGSRGSAARAALALLSRLAPLLDGSLVGRGGGNGILMHPAAPSAVDSDTHKPQQEQQREQQLGWKAPQETGRAGVAAACVAQPGHVQRQRSSDGHVCLPPQQQQQLALVAWQQHQVLQDA